MRIRSEFGGQFPPIQFRRLHRTAGIVCNARTFTRDYYATRRHRQPASRNTFGRMHKTARIFSLLSMQMRANAVLQQLLVRSK